MINFWSYKDEYNKYRPKFNKFFDQTLKNGKIFFGPNLKNFEDNFIKKYKSKYGIAVGSGTDALLISLIAMNIKSGDEVITASNTAIPTISAIINSGAKPVLVDINEDYLIDINKIEKKISIDFPNSLGMLYSTITAYLGFKPNEGEYKVMGLAPYGDSKVYFTELLSVFENTSNKFTINQKYFTWEYSDKIMFNRRLCKLLNLPPRLPEEKVTQDHKNLAAALQKLYEYQFLKLVKTAKNITGSDNLCISGGCAYNGKANSLAYKFFKSIYIPFAPSDAGSAIGACLNSKIKIDPYLGPEFSDKVVKSVVNKYKPNLYIFKLNERFF